MVMKEGIKEPVPANSETSPDDAIFVQGMKDLVPEGGQGYELCAEGPSYKVWKKDMKDGHVSTKSTATFSDIPVEDLVTIMQNDNFRQTYEKVFCNPKSLEKLGPNTDIYYFQIDPPVMMISKRDFVVKRTILRNYKGTYFFVHMESIDTPLMPVQKGIVRGHVISQSRVITPTPDGKGSIVTTSGQMDLGGNIPSWVINKNAYKGPVKSVETIKESYPKWKKENKLAQYAGH